MLAALAVEHELGHTRLVDTQLDALINVAIGMTGDSDGLLPVLHSRLDARNGNRCAEHGAIEDASNRSIRRLPHLVQVVLRHALGIRGDGGTLHGNAQAFRGFGRLNGDLVACLIALHQAKVEVLSFQIDERQNQFVLNHFPQDASHLVAIHLDQRSGHLDFLFHFYLVYCSCMFIASREILQNLFQNLTKL